MGATIGHMAEISEGSGDHTREQREHGGFHGKGKVE